MLSQNQTEKSEKGRNVAPGIFCCTGYFGLRCFKRKIKAIGRYLAMRLKFLLAFWGRARCGVVFTALERSV